MDFHSKKNFTGKNLVPQSGSKKSPYTQFQRDEEAATKGKYKKYNRRKIINRLVNTTGNSRNGQSYSVTTTKGGVYHTYDNGKKVFVRKKTRTVPDITDTRIK